MNLRRMHIALAGLALITGAAFAGQPVPSTISLTGMHCQGCVGPVEQGLNKTPGVAGAKVDFAAKTARLSLDEQKTSVSQVVNGLARIPHAMGSGMKYGGLLAITLKATAAQTAAASKAVAHIAGVQSATVKGSQLLVAFKPGASVTSAQISRAVAKAGGKAVSLDTPTPASNAAHTPASGAAGSCCGSPGK